MTCLGSRGVEYRPNITLFSRRYIDSQQRVFLRCYIPLFVYAETMGSCMNSELTLTIDGLPQERLPFFLLCIAYIWFVLIIITWYTVIKDPLYNSVYMYNWNQSTSWQWLHYVSFPVDSKSKIFKLIGIHMHLIDVVKGMPKHNIFIFSDYDGMHWK